MVIQAVDKTNFPNDVPREGDSTPRGAAAEGCDYRGILSPQPPASDLLKSVGLLRVAVFPQGGFCYAVAGATMTPRFSIGTKSRAV